MSEFEEKNILIYGTPSGTIEIKPHPKDIIDVDPEILLIMQARLKGQNLDEIYSQDDRVSNEFMIRKERDKLKEVFATPEQVLDGFSSVKNLKAIRQELRFTGINHEILSSYTLKQSNGSPVDEVDAYIAVLTGSVPEAKVARLMDFEKSQAILSADASSIFGLVKPYYRTSHFSPFSVNKEMLEITPSLRGMFKEAQFSEWFGEILQQMYGRLA